MVSEKKLILKYLTHISTDISTEISGEPKNSL